MFDNFGKGFDENIINYFTTTSYIIKQYKEK